MSMLSIRFCIDFSTSAGVMKGMDPDESLRSSSGLTEITAGAVYSTNLGRKVGAAEPGLMLMVPVPVLGPLPPYFWFHSPRLQM